MAHEFYPTRTQELGAALILQALQRWLLCFLGIAGRIDFACLIETVGFVLFGC